MKTPILVVLFAAVLTTGTFVGLSITSGSRRDGQIANEDTHSGDDGPKSNVSDIPADRAGLRSGNPSDLETSRRGGDTTAPGTRETISKNQSLVNVTQMGSDYLPGTRDLRPHRSDENRFSDLWEKHCQSMKEQGFDRSVYDAFTNPQLLGNQLVAIHPYRVTQQKAQELAHTGGAQILDVSRVAPLTEFSFIEWCRGAFAQQTLDHWRVALMRGNEVCGIPPFGRREVWPLNGEDPRLLSLFLFTWDAEDLISSCPEASKAGSLGGSSSLLDWRRFIIGEWEYVSRHKTIDTTTRLVFLENGTVQRWRDRMSDPRRVGSRFLRESGTLWEDRTYRWEISSPGRLRILEEHGKIFDEGIVDAGHPAVLNTGRNGTLFKVQREWGRSLETLPYEFDKHWLGLRSAERSMPIEMRHFAQGKTTLCAGFALGMCLQQSYGRSFSREAILRLCDVATGGNSETSGKAISVGGLLRQLGIPYETVCCTPAKFPADPLKWRIGKALENGPGQRQIMYDEFQISEDGGKGAAVEYFVRSEMMPKLQEGYMVAVSHKHAHKPRGASGHVVALRGYNKDFGTTTLYNSTFSKQREVNLMKWCDGVWNHDKQYAFYFFVLPKIWQDSRRDALLSDEILLTPTLASLDFCRIGNRPLEEATTDGKMPPGPLAARSYQAPPGLAAYNWAILGDIDSAAFHESRIWLLKFNVACGRSTYVARGRSRHDYSLYLVSGYRSGEFRISYLKENADGTLCGEEMTEWIGADDLLNSMKIPWPPTPEIEARREHFSRMAKEEEDAVKRAMWKRGAERLSKPIYCMYYYHNMKTPFLDFVE